MTRESRTYWSDFPATIKQNILTPPTPVAMEKASFTNPPFELRPFPFDFMREKAVDDYFIWHIDVVTATYTVHVMLPLEAIIRYCAQAHPEAYRYMEAVSDGIDGRGFKHYEMLEVFEKDGFDLLPLAYSYIRDHKDLDARHAHEVQLDALKNDPEYIRAMQEKVATLRTYFSPPADSEKRLQKLEDDLLAYLNTKVLDIYPELLERDPELILALKDIITTTAWNFAQAIDHLYCRDPEATDR